MGYRLESTIYKNPNEIFTVLEYIKFMTIPEMCRIPFFTLSSHKPEIFYCFLS